MRNVGIIGGGIAGLTCAYKLAAEGHAVTVYEASKYVGGLGVDFDHKGNSIDKFYHVLLDSDRYLVNLLQEMGLASKLLWAPTGMGFMVKEKLYPFNTPVDLLRFKALPFLDRVRTGLAALYITKQKNGFPLDDIPATDWLKRLFGQTVYQNIWDPLLAAKFGERRGEIPAYWVWNTLTREKDGTQEVKGYVVGGYRYIAETIATNVQKLGGNIQCGVPVDTLDQLEVGMSVCAGGTVRRHDAVISTLPMTLLRGIVNSPLLEKLPLANLKYQGCLNVVLVLKKRLSPYYWIAVVDSGFSFQGVVETTHVVPPESVSGRHIVYVMNYGATDLPAYLMSDQEACFRAETELCRLFPQLTAADIEASYAFRAPFVEPVWPLGYLRVRAAPKVTGTDLYLCTTAQAYPMVTAWNTSVYLAMETVNAMRPFLS
ncbi:MAG: FAD-dependent oxidoreductase [Myxococcales bacterium]|nr:FAD-dependent oxidoreductase [Myxococcales bacterium]